MTVREEILHVQQVVVRPRSADCDRCGRSLRRVSGIAVDEAFPWSGAQVRARIYARSGNSAATERVEAELCDKCVEELALWINAGEGAGVRSFYPNAK